MVRLRISRILAAVVLITSIMILIIGEYYSYIIAPYNWLKLYPMEEKSKFLRILIVSDPQLIGYHGAPFPLNYLAIFDCDRYLEKTFRLAFDFVQPEMIIFLGDLLDEGTIALELEYTDYVSRFHTIFGVGKNIIKLHVPGDNDIGGEWRDSYSDLHFIRFERIADDRKQFSQLSFDFIDFVKVNLLNNRYEIMNNRRIERRDNTSSAVVVSISHLPLLDSYAYNVHKVLKFIKPHLILSGHTHEAALTVLNFRAKSHYFEPIQIDSSPIHIQLDRSKVVEITTPTCSYRMGVSRIGYGYLILEKVGGRVHLQYTVLWNPRRLLNGMGWRFHGFIVFFSLCCFCSAHLAFLVNTLTGCVYFRLWKAYDIFWLWSLLIVTGCIPSLRFDNNILNWLQWITGICFQKLSCRQVLQAQVDEEKAASETASNVARALNFAVDLLRLRISAAILIGNFTLKTRNFQVGLQAALNFLEWDPFRIMLWIDLSLFWLTISLAWWRQFFLCCRLGCCRFYFLCFGVVIIGALIMEWPMQYLYKHMDETRCRLDWSHVYNTTFGKG